LVPKRAYTLVGRKKERKNHFVEVIKYDYEVKDKIVKDISRSLVVGAYIYGT